MHAKYFIAKHKKKVMRGLEIRNRRNRKEMITIQPLRSQPLQALFLMAPQQILKDRSEKQM